MISPGPPPSNIRTEAAARIGCLFNRQAGVRSAYRCSTRDRTSGRRPERGTRADANRLPSDPTPRATARRSESNAREADCCTGWEEDREAKTDELRSDDMPEGCQRSTRAFGPRPEC